MSTKNDIIQGTGQVDVKDLTRGLWYKTLQKINIFHGKLVFFLLSVTFIHLDKHTSLMQICTLQTRNVFKVQATEG